jgi:hypothetical protein
MKSPEKFRLKKIHPKGHKHTLNNYARLRTPRTPPLAKPRSTALKSRMLSVIITIVKRLTALLHQP